MNFQTFLEELDRLYEEEAIKAAPEVDEETEAKEEPLTEAAEEAIDDEEIEIVDDEEATDEEDVVEEESKEAEPQLVLECAKCGGLVIKVESAVEVAEETGLANVEDVCQYCEGEDGYKVLGVLAPYAQEVSTEAAIDMEEKEAEPVEADD